MTRFISNTVAGLVAVFVLSATIAAKDTPSKADSQIGFIQLGYISRIDAKNHTVMLLTPKDQKDDQAGVPPHLGGFARIGRLGRFGGPSPQDIARQMQRTYETKVVVSSETILKDREGPLRFDDLNVGDFVEVEGVMHGNDFRAKQLSRHSRKSDSQKNQ
jgi:Domain of unknown function (DUF5666)